MEEYENSNRAFVQLFLARNVLTFEQARPLLAAIFSLHEEKPVSAEDITHEDFTSMLAAANDALSPLDFEIRSALHQETRERYYALVNATSDALTQIATVHSTDEITYVKRLLDAMFETNNTEKREAMCVAGKDALNLVQADHREHVGERTQPSFNMTQTDAEALLSHLTAEGWLEKSARGFYSLSLRGLIELKPWLVETYNDEENDVYKIKSCQACKDIVTVVSSFSPNTRATADCLQGQRCPTPGCPVRIHNICTQNYFRSRRSQDCPTCKTTWDGSHFVGERAITTSESYLKGRRRSGVLPRIDNDEDEDAQTSE